MSALVDTIAKNEKAFREKAGNGNYTLTPSTLSAGGNSVDIVDCRRKDGDTSYYYTEETTKTAIVLHYTAGQLVGDIPTLTAKDNKVSTAFVLARDGTPYRLFDEKYWSYHLGKDCVGGNSVNSKRTVAIEISNFGWVSESGNNLKIYSGSGVYCTKDETALFHTLPADWRGHRFYATFTKEQYASLKKLLRYLCAKYNIPYKFLSGSGGAASAPRYNLFASADDAKGYKGIAAHSNFRSDKWDIGPAFDWHKLEEEGGTELCLPVDIGQGFRGTRLALDGYYAHTEATIKSGYYPLGVNTVWHGGVHVRGEERAPVRAAAPGRVVAARLAGEAAKATGSYGSHNFVLLRHTVAVGTAKKHFWSLYMHLHHEELAASNETLKTIPWLQKPAAPSKDKYRIKIADLNFRSSPSSVSKDNILSAFAKDEIVKVIDAKTSAPWWKVERPSKAQGYVKYNPDWLEPAADGGGLDEELLGKLKDGKVVVPDRAVRAGDPLWTMGLYGSAGYRAALVHWEIFSEENLLGDAKRYPGWVAVEDASEDFNVDSKKIVGLVDQDAGWFESDEVLTVEELNRFYASQNKNVKALRRYCCKFVSEWGVDLDKAIDKMLGRFIKYGLKERMAPYVFWKDAADAKVPLPASRVVWHYHPVAFIEGLLDPVLEEADAVAAPEERPEPSADGEECACGSTKDSLYVAMKATPTVAKDMYQAIKKYWTTTYGASKPAHLHEDVAMVLMGHIAGEVGWDAKSMKNNNVGNHKKKSGKSFTAFSTWEEYKTEEGAKKAASCEKHTKYLGKMEGKSTYGVRFYPPHKQTHFAAFSSLDGGVKAHVDLLRGKYTGAFEALAEHAKGDADSADSDDRAARVEDLAEEYADSLTGYATADNYKDYIVACAKTAYKKFKDSP